TSNPFPFSDRFFLKVYLRGVSSKLTGSVARSFSAMVRVFPSKLRMMGSLESLLVERSSVSFSVDSFFGPLLQQTRRRMARVKRILDGFMAILSFGTFHIDRSRYGNGCL